MVGGSPLGKMLFFRNARQIVNVFDLWEVGVDRTHMTNSWEGRKVLQMLAQRRWCTPLHKPHGVSQWNSLGFHSLPCAVLSSSRALNNQGLASRKQLKTGPRQRDAIPPVKINNKSLGRIKPAAYVNPPCNCDRFANRDFFFNFGPLGEGPFFVTPSEAPIFFLITNSTPPQNGPCDLPRWGATPWWVEGTPSVLKKITVVEDPQALGGTPWGAATSPP